MEAAGAGPAVGTAEDRGVAIGLLHPLEFTGNHVQRLVPRYGHKGFCAASPAAVRPVLQPALADHGPTDAALGIHCVRDRLDDRRRIGVAFEGMDADDAPVAHFGLENAPV